MSHSRRNAIIIALGVILVALGIRYSRGHNFAYIYTNPGVPTLGKPGSEHTHQSLLVIIGGVPLDLAQDKYLERSPYAHLHQDLGFFIHKHATGVTLPYFFETLGMKLTRDCLTLDTAQIYCTGESADTAALSIYLNREPFMGNLEQYELRDGDKILIDYSTSSPMELLLEANSIPDLPDDLEQKG